MLYIVIQKDQIMTVMMQYRDDGTSRTHFRKFADSGIDFPFLSGSAAEDSWIIRTI